jgi:hypothetical protein
MRRRTTTAEETQWMVGGGGATTALRTMTKSNNQQVRLINLKGTIGCFGGSKKSNWTDRIAEKSLFE